MEPLQRSRRESSDEPTQESGLTTTGQTTVTTTLTDSTPTTTDASTSLKKKSILTESTPTTTDPSSSLKKKSLQLSYNIKSPNSPDSGSAPNIAKRMSQQLGESQSSGSVSVFKIKSQIEKMPQMDRMPQITEDAKKKLGPEDSSTSQRKKQGPESKSTTTETIREKSSKSTKSVASIKQQKLVVIEDSVTNKTIMVNPDCYKQLVIDYIYEQAQIPKAVIMDLADENGCLIGIETLQACDKASLLMDHKRNYVVIFHEHAPNGTLTYIEPMMYKINRQDADFLVRFHRNNPIFSTYIDRDRIGSFSKSINSSKRVRQKSISKKSVSTF